MVRRSKIKVLEKREFIKIESEELERVIGTNRHNKCLTNGNVEIKLFHVSCYFNYYLVITDKECPNVSYIYCLNYMGRDEKEFLVEVNAIIRIIIRRITEEGFYKVINEYMNKDRLLKEIPSNGGLLCF